MEYQPSARPLVSIVVLSKKEARSSSISVEAQSRKTQSFNEEPSRTVVSIEVLLPLLLSPWNAKSDCDTPLTNVDQPPTESLLALAPEPLSLTFLPPNDSLSTNKFDWKDTNSSVFSSVVSMVIPSSNELFDRKADPEKEDEECTNGYIPEQHTPLLLPAPSSSIPLTNSASWLLLPSIEMDRKSREEEKRTISNLMSISTNDNDSPLFIQIFDNDNNSEIFQSSGPFDGGNNN